MFLSGQVQFTLGKTFDLNLDASANASAQGQFDLGNTSSGSGSFFVQLIFLEADGTTPVAVIANPVAVTATPEPGSWVLSSLGLFLMVAAHSRRKPRDIAGAAASAD